MHCDASNEAIRSVLVQNITIKIDLLIYYVSWLLNQVEQSYTRTKRKALATVYSIQIFYHYLLANHFIFYVNHQALLYLIKRLLVLRRAVR